MYGDQNRRAEELWKKILFIEDVFKEYSIRSTAPETVEELERALGKLVQSKQCTESQLFSSLEFEINKQEAFVKQQRNLILDSVDSFKTLLAKISVLTQVAKEIGLGDIKSDEEQALLTTKEKDLNEGLL